MSTNNQIIQDIWIAVKGGTVIFNRVYDEKVDPQLFGGLMTALNVFSEEMFGKFSSFEYAGIRFSIIKENSLLFIANSDVKVKPKRLNLELRKIVKRFFILYPLKEITKQTHNPSYFNDFEKEIGIKKIQFLKTNLFGSRC